MPCPLPTRISQIAIIQIRCASAYHSPLTTPQTRFNTGFMLCQDAISANSNQRSVAASIARVKASTCWYNWRTLVTSPGGAL